MRQNSSARSARPSASSSADSGIALYEDGIARASAGSIRRPSFANSTIWYSAVPGLPS